MGCLEFFSNEPVNTHNRLRWKRWGGGKDSGVVGVIGVVSLRQCSFLLSADLVAALLFVHCTVLCQRRPYPKSQTAKVFFWLVLVCSVLLYVAQHPGSKKYCTSRYCTPLLSPPLWSLSSRALLHYYTRNCSVSYSDRGWTPRVFNFTSTAIEPHSFRIKYSKRWPMKTHTRVCLRNHYLIRIESYYIDVCFVLFVLVTYTWVNCA